MTTRLPEYPRDPAQERVVRAEPLREFARRILVKSRMFPRDADIVADRMVEADLRGVVSHGTRALPRYLAAIDSADIDPRADLLTEVETPALAVMNGGGGMGHVAATKGMELAIRKAGEVGTGTVVVKKSHHYGACGLYALMAAREGMIGFTTTSTGRPNLAAYGSTAGAECNHGLAWAAPVQSGPPVVLDMAVAHSSWGKIQMLGEYGLPIPAEWAVDEAGRPTTDAAAAKLLLPPAGPRGFGMAFFCSVLTGGLAGGKFPIDKPRPVEVEGGEHYFQAMDVKQFVSLDRFYERIASACDQIRELPPAAGFDRVMLPGQRESEFAEQQAQNGIALHTAHVEELESLAAKHKVEFTW